MGHRIETWARQTKHADGITLLDDSGGIQDFLSSGMTGEEAGRLWALPDGMRLFEYLGSISEPLRLPDLLGHIRSMGLPELRSPVAVGPVVSFLAAPVLHRTGLEPARCAAIWMVSSCPDSYGLRDVARPA